MRVNEKVQLKWMETNESKYKQINESKLEGLTQMNKLF